LKKSLKIKKILKKLEKIIRVLMKKVETLSKVESLMSVGQCVLAMIDQQTQGTMTDQCRGSSKL
jgi:nucleoside permease NupC